MSVEITANVFKYSNQKATKRLLLVILADSANAFGVAYPGVETLAAYANVTERSISRHLSGPEADGELYIHRRPGLHNVYIVLPGLTDEQRAQAVQFINTAFPGSEPLKISDLPLTEVSAPPDKTVGGQDDDTPDKSVRGDESGTPDRSVRGQPPEPPTEVSVPPDRSVRRSKDSVVVGDTQKDSDSDQQQQLRDPTPVERELLDAEHVPESIWRNWMHCESETVVAAVMHATQEAGVKNALGLMRAMLEQGKAAPADRYRQLARDKLGHEAYSAALEAAGWDPRLVEETS